MASYLLLRNNQKSGPLSFDELLKSGLKPYDLVWVEGKSAAWRYPSEIPELKPYAPVVEEQPYDRFYKKEPETEKPVVVIQDKYAIEEKYEKYIPKKSVFVTMPGSAQAQKPQPQVKKPEPAPVIEETPVIKVTENPEAAKIKFSQPLDEIKEMYVKTLQQRKTKIARKSFLLANMKRAAVILGLVALGVVAGLAIKSNSGSNTTLADQTLKGSVPVTAAIPDITTPDLSGEEENNPTDNTTHIADPGPQMPLKVKERLQAHEEKELTTPTLRRDPPMVVTLAEKERITEKQQNAEPSAPVEKDPVTGERSRKVRSDVTDDKPVAKSVMLPRKSGLESLVSVTSNEYKRVAFGGIRNLELTVTNDSKFVLDKVTVELNYLKPSEEPLKTELVKFLSVSPNGSVTIKIKDTNRGIKVSYRIVEIQTQQTETAAGF